MDSLIVGLVGMTLVFMGLGIVAVSIYLLDLIFRERGQAPSTQETPQVEPGEANEGAVVAAIALALAKLQSSQQPRSDLGRNLEQEEMGAWVLSARSRQLRGEGRRR